MSALRANVLRSQDGASFVAVLMALLIASALYFGYFELQQKGGERSTSIAAVNGSRAFACRTNRQTIERQLLMWTVNHPDETPTLDDVERESGPLASCPEGGTYSLNGRSVVCSLHQ
jgi:hypothetical protein